MLHEEPELNPNLTHPKRLGLPSSPRIIAVTSGKGGVGKTNIVANLGLALVMRGCKVLLIDADLGLANLDILLGLSPQATIHEVLSLRKTLEEVVWEGPLGLKVLPASSGIPELADLNENQKLFLLTELDHYAERLDVVLIDTGAGISSNVLFFNITARERIVVANNEPTALTDAYALIKVLATRHGETRFKVLANAVSHPGEGQALYRSLMKVADRFLGQEVVLDYLGSIPHDNAVPKSVCLQQPVLSLFPEAPASQSFLRLAQKLWEEPPPLQIDSSIKFFWRRLIKHHP
ncbi:MAG: MinD/ParA family protein [Deltaproteobacteria bacterium]|nr:MinD/ParA family protein [Deltaproteobacteria bacterium]